MCVIPENVLLMKIRTMFDGIAGKFSRHPRINFCHLDSPLSVTLVTTRSVLQLLAINIYSNSTFYLMLFCYMQF